MTKFVGKFRKNKDYNDDYNFVVKHRSKNEHAEIRKILAQHEEEMVEEEFNKPEELPHWNQYNHSE